MEQNAYGFEFEFEFELELEQIKSLIEERRVRRVGLQIPSGLKRVAVAIVAEICKETGADVILSGNSCYGPCDIDWKLKEIVDILIHFGHTATSAFPIGNGESRGVGDGVDRQLKEKIHDNVLFVGLRSTIEIEPVVEMAVAEIRGDRLALVATLQHLHRLDGAKAVLARAGKQAVIGKDGQVLGCEFSSCAQFSCDEVLFVGSGSFHPAGIALYTGKRVIAADPFMGRISVFEQNKLIRERYNVIGRALDANSFGILIGMKSGQFKLDAAVALQRRAAAKGLEAYLIALDEINEDQLLGFKVDGFVNTACPRLAEDFVHFKKPVLSINEFEIVLGERSWDDII